MNAVSQLKFHSFRNHIHLQRLGGEWSPSAGCQLALDAFWKDHSGHCERRLRVSRLDRRGLHLPAIVRSLTNAPPLQVYATFPGMPGGPVPFGNWLSSTPVPFILSLRIPVL